MKVPVDIEKYMQCEWRSANMCLLDFLQRSDREGNIHSSLKQRYKQTSAGSTLEEFANRCSTNGTVMVAAVKYSRRNSSFYKQWLLLHVPFRQVDDLWNEAVEAVPPELQGSALCLLQSSEVLEIHARNLSRNGVGVLTRLNHREHSRSSQSSTEVIDAYLSGRRQITEPPRVDATPSLVLE